MNKKVFFVLLVNLGLVLCGNVSFEDCGGTYELEEVQIDGCERTSVCVLSTGATINVTALITASSQVSTTLVHEASVVVNSIQTPLDVSPDACAASACPIYSLAETTYSARFTMPSSVALNTRGTLEWKIWNDSNSMVVCFRVTIETASQFHIFLRRLLKGDQSQRFIK